MLNKKIIKQRYTKCSEDHIRKKHKILPSKFDEVEDKLFEWICVVIKADIISSPSLVNSKAIKVKQELQIDKKELKALWKLLSSLIGRECNDLKGIIIFGKRCKVNKDDLKLLSKIN